MVRLSLLALSAATISAVSAHFQLNYPQTRGFNEDNEPQAPCGGFNNVGSRTEFPLENGFVQINSGHTTYKYTVKVITSNNPSTSDFTGNNATVIGSGSRNYPGDACLTVSTNNGTDIKAGTNATIQITYDGGDGSLYQCTDVTFVENPSNFNSSACVNADGSKPGESGSSDGESGASSVTTAVGGIVLAAVAGAISLL
ncbi:hypothetical protein LRAMOSA04495 [Lichtheimia ramosa]|uniref:Copper acquisition factor BIM1-like domain-containing protein n=1 Tax=Lichtheimia ramosa TaxID=688394 RepID=A0A077WYE6_9FUNG|nr:hypothetical protein LRAMOSA04495 [Lichtheimia ramosa]